MLVLDDERYEPDLDAILARWRVLEMDGWAITLMERHDGLRQLFDDCSEMLNALLVERDWASRVLDASR